MKWFLKIMLSSLFLFIGLLNFALLKNTNNVKTTESLSGNLNDGSSPLAVNSKGGGGDKDYDIQNTISSISLTIFNPSNLLKFDVTLSQTNNHPGISFKWEIIYQDNNSNPVSIENTTSNNTIDYNFFLSANDIANQKLIVNIDEHLLLVLPDGTIDHVNSIVYTFTFDFSKLANINPNINFSLGNSSPSHIYNIGKIATIFNGDLKAQTWTGNFDLIYLNLSNFYDVNTYSIFLNKIFLITSTDLNNTNFTIQKSEITLFLSTSSPIAINSTQLNTSASNNLLTLNPAFTTGLEWDGYQNKFLQWGNSTIFLPIEQTDQVQKLQYSANLNSIINIPFVCNITLSNSKPFLGANGIFSFNSDSRSFANWMS